MNLSMIGWVQPAHIGTVATVCMCVCVVIGKRKVERERYKVLVGNGKHIHRASQRG